MKSIHILLFSTLFFIACNNPDNWNQYLGPNRNATIVKADLPGSYSELKIIKQWEFKLGPGYGGAAIYDNEIFILDRIKGKSDLLRCIDIKSGQEKWNFIYDAPGEIPYPGSRSVPYVEENYVWSVGPHGHFYCIDKKTHQPVWFCDIKKEFDAELPYWGFSQSPLGYKNLIIIAPQGKKAGLAAFNKESGERVWKSRPLTGYNFHVSPQIANFGGIDQVVMISPYDRRDSTKIQEVAGFEANTGRELWKYKGLKSFATITPATIIDERRLLLTDCSYKGNFDPVSILLEITKNEDKFMVKELFKIETAGSKMHPPVFYQNHFYLNNTGRPMGMTCLNINGEVLWEKGTAPNFELGALIMIENLIVNQNGKNGDLHFIKPSPKGYEELGKVSFFDSKKSQAWSPPAFSAGKLIVRDMEKMVCVDLGS